VSQLEKDREDGSGLWSKPDAAAFLSDAAGTICWWSDGAERLFGYTSAEAVGQTMERLFSVDASDGRGSFVTESTVHSWNPHTRQATGQVSAAKLWRTVTALRGAGGEALSLHLVWPATARDVVPASWPEIPKEYVGTVAARVAHDFSSLLAPVIGNVTLMEEEISSQQPLYRRVVGARQAAEEARSFAQRLAALDPKRKLALRPGNLAQIVRDLLPEWRAALPSNIEIITSLDDCPDSVDVDRRQLGHALQELARNARDAMPGGGSFAVSLAVLDGTSGDTAVPPGRWVSLQVRDTGSGMEPSLLAHAFEPFVTTRTPSCGIGLGLPTVAAIVRQHDGLISAESRPGHGTTFSIFLPSRGPLTDKSVAPSPVRAEAAPVAATPVASANILLVEDNSMVRRSIEATLRGLGHRVVAVASGDECIAAVGQATLPIDLLITDVVMPEMSGKELIDRVRTILPDLPVLFMSGYDRSTLASRRQSVSAEHFLQKPFDCEDLVAAVLSAMAGKSTR
jgi:two-component system, cell cycle sensor histidine kinase and response regulator CckA